MGTGTVRRLTLGFGACCPRMCHLIASCRLTRTPLASAWAYISLAGILLVIQNPRQPRVGLNRVSAWKNVLVCSFIRPHSLCYFGILNATARNSCLELTYDVIFRKRSTQKSNSFVRLLNVDLKLRDPHWWPAWLYGLRVTWLRIRARGKECWSCWRQRRRYMAGRRRIFARSLWAFGKASIQYSRFVLFMAGTGWKQRQYIVCCFVAGRVAIVSGKSDPRFGINFNTSSPDIISLELEPHSGGDEIPELHRI
jgi:hypothetical protein